MRTGLKRAGVRLVLAGGAGALVAVTAALAFVVGIGGVASLVNGSALTVRETRLAFALLHEEVDEVLKERR